MCQENMNMRYNHRQTDFATVALRNKQFDANVKIAALKNHADNDY